VAAHGRLGRVCVGLKVSLIAHSRKKGLKKSEEWGFGQGEL